MKIRNKRELQQTLYNHSATVTFKDFKKQKITIYKRSICILVVDIILPCDYPSRFRKNLTSLNIQGLLNLELWNFTFDKL